MPAYIIAQMSVHDTETYKKYALQVASTMGSFGGKLLVAADDAVELEGQRPYPRTVIGEFADAATARAWYESDAYQQIQPLRASSTDGAVYIIEGFGLPSTPHRPATTDRQP